MHMINI